MTISISILLIEDDSACADALLKYLNRNEMFDAKIECASSVHDAIDILNKCDIDVILTDIQLPDCRGIETVKIIHAHARKIPIIAISGAVFDIISDDWVKYGVRDFFNKGENIFQGLIKRILFEARRYQLNKQKWDVIRSRFAKSLIEIGESHAV